MTVQPLEPGQPVAVRFAGRDVCGVVDDIRWRPSFNDSLEEIVVDANGTRIATGRTHVQPR